MTPPSRDERLAFVTGGCGFVGRNFVPALTARGWSVSTFNRTSSENGKSSWSIKQAIAEAAESGPIQVVFHLAGRINGSPEEIERDNVEITRSLISAMRDLRPKPKLIYLSSVSAQDELGPYGRAKRRAEDLVRASGTDFVIIRSSLIYGPHEKSNVARLIAAVRRWPAIPIPGGRTTKLQPLYVDDLVEALIAAVSPTSKDEYIVAGPRQEPLWDMVRTICTTLGRFPALVPIPLGPIQIAALVLSRLPLRNLPLQQIATLHNHPAWDFSEAQRDLNFIPRTFQEGIGLYVSAMPNSGNPQLVG